MVMKLARSSSVTSVASLANDRSFQTPLHATGLSRNAYSSTPTAPSPPRVLKSEMSLSWVPTGGSPLSSPGTSMTAPVVVRPTSLPGLFIPTHRDSPRGHGCSISSQAAPRPTPSRGHGASQVSQPSLITRARSAEVLPKATLSATTAPRSSRRRSSQQSLLPAPRCEPATSTPAAPSRASTPSSLTVHPGSATVPPGRSHADQSTMEALRSSVLQSLAPLRHELHALCNMMGNRTETLQTQLDRVETKLSSRIDALEDRMQMIDSTRQASPAHKPTVRGIFHGADNLEHCVASATTAAPNSPGGMGSRGDPHISPWSSEFDAASGTPSQSAGSSAIVPVLGPAKERARNPPLSARSQHGRQRPDRNGSPVKQAWTAQERSPTNGRSKDASRPASCRQHQESGRELPQRSRSSDAQAWAGQERSPSNGRSKDTSRPPCRQHQESARELRQRSRSPDPQACRERVPAQPRAHLKDTKRGRGASVAAEADIGNPSLAGLWSLAMPKALIPDSHHRVRPSCGGREEKSHWEGDNLDMISRKCTARPR